MTSQPVGPAVVAPDAVSSEIGRAATLTAATMTAATSPRRVAALAFAAEAGLLWLFATGRLHPAVLLVGHIAVVAALAFHVYRLATANSTITASFILGIAVAATGPIGALASLMVTLLPRGRVSSPRLLREWYSRIALSAEVDQTTRLCDNVTSGRHVGLTAPQPASFVTVLERGSLADRQAALGLMARHIKPDYLAALKAALQSSEPVIRVQAAAVATKIRPELRALVDKAVAAFEAGTLPADTALDVARDLQSCVACGLLDAGDRIRAEVMIPRLQALGATAPVRTSAVSPAQETMLLRAGRFRELRVARRIAAARVSIGGAMGRVRMRRGYQPRQPNGAALAHSPTLGPPTLGPPTLGPPTLGPPTLGPPTLGPPTLEPLTLEPLTLEPQDTWLASNQPGGQP